MKFFCLVAFLNLLGVPIAIPITLSPHQSFLSFSFVFIKYFLCDRMLYCSFVSYIFNLFTFLLLSSFSFSPFSPLSLFSFLHSLKGGSFIWILPLNSLFSFISFPSFSMPFLFLYSFLFFHLLLSFILVSFLLLSFFPSFRFFHFYSIPFLTFLPFVFSFFPIYSCIHLPFFFSLFIPAFSFAFPKRWRQCISVNCRPSLAVAPDCSVGIWHRVKTFCRLWASSSQRTEFWVNVTVDVCGCMEVKTQRMMWCLPIMCSNSFVDRVVLYSDITSSQRLACVWESSLLTLIYIHLHLYMHTHTYTHIYCPYVSVCLYWIEMTYVLMLVESVWSSLYIFKVCLNWICFPSASTVNIPVRSTELS